MPSYEDIRLINNVLNLYYVEKLTQADIAEALNLSTAKVNRLIQHAREQGYINFVVRTPYQHLFDLENRIKAVFDLQDVIVIPAVGDTNSSLLSAIGSVAANFFLDHIRDGDVIAITPGTTVQAVAQSLDTTRSYDVEIVPILGASQGSIESDMNYLANHMAERLNARSYKLNAPAFVDSKEHSELLRSMAPVKKILDIARNANVALLGVGMLDPEISRFVEFTALSAKDMKNIVEHCGGVGEIGASIYDIEGRPCGQEYTERVIGLSLDEIRSIPYRIGVAASAAKSLPIFGALRGGYLNALITDESAARGILKIFDEKFRVKT